MCLPWLRYAQPNLPRPIRVPLVFPIVYLIATLFVTVVPMYASPVETGYGILMILSSVPVYLVFVLWKNKPKFFQRFMGKIVENAFIDVFKIFSLASYSGLNVFNISRWIYFYTSENDDGRSSQNCFKGFYFNFYF